jgi:signal transduction histidine kinase
LQQEGNKTKLAFFHTSRLALYYHLGKFDEALVESEILQSYRANIPGDLCEALHAFYTSLTISACYEGLSKNKKTKYLKIFKRHLADMNRWAKGCPQNYQQHLFLMQAEQFVLKNRLNDALTFYEKSIQTASLNHFHNVEALACERAALFCAKSQLQRQSNHFIAETWDANHKWGAVLKCNQLENEYPDVFRAKANYISKVKNIHGDTTLSSKTALDLASVLKASQSITSQVKYDDLLKKLMHITIENAGAERGCLLLYKENRLCIEALAISGSESIEILPSVPVNEMQIMPDSILNYCWRLKEVIVVNDAFNEGQFSSDAFIQKHRIYSVLCLPISAVGKIIGLLYLENRLIKGVFNKNRIELLQMLSGQIGISIENAILYGNLEEKVMQRTREIEKALTELKATQSQLIQAEKMASLGELTAGIAHEIQNPLNFVNNFSEVSAELLDEMNEELDKGEFEEAKAIAYDVRQNLEKINHHGKRADSIVKGMLQHSRTNSGQKELTDINILAEEYLRLAFHGLKAKDKSFNATMETDFDESVGNINIVPQDIGRVILNLITNAFYAVREKSSYANATEGTYEPTVTVSTKHLGDKIEISVKDNGNGIPENIRDKIFQPFFTTKPTGEGTGLGLSLSYDIVKAHGGELKVETNVGEGSVFIIQLPAYYEHIGNNKSYS